MASRPIKTPCGVTHTASSVKSAARSEALSSVKAVLSCKFSSPSSSSDAGIAGKIARKGKSRCGEAMQETYKGSKSLFILIQRTAKNRNSQTRVSLAKWSPRLLWHQLPELSHQPFRLILWQWKIRTRNDPAAAVTSRLPFTDVEDQFL